MIDRRFYRREYDAAMTLAAFNSRLRQETDRDSLSDDVLEVVKETMQPEHAPLTP
jgi:dihydroorotase-like cyclic amidohydrolase